MESVIETTTLKEQEIARENLPKIRKLATSFSGRSKPVSIRVEDHDVVTLNIPAKLFHVLQSILDLMAKGKSFSLVPANAELTTQEAAEMLNVSRPFITKLLKEGLITYKQVGSHRRIPLEDLMEYAAKMKRSRKKALDELSGLGQEFNM